MTEDSARSRRRLMPDLLLVEDNPLHLRLVKSMLSDIWPPNEVAEVRHARSLEEAIQQIRAEAPDCVLLDLVLPDADGMDTLRGVRGADPLVPIVVLSSHEDSELARRAIADGAQDYLVKGAVSPGDLERSIAFAMGRKNHERETVAAMPGITPWPTSAAEMPQDETESASTDSTEPPLGIAVIRESGPILFVDSAVTRSVGRSIDEAISTDLDEMIHPNDKVAWNKLMGGEPGPIDVRFLHVSGHPIFLKATAHYVAAGGDADGALVVTFYPRHEEGTVSSGAYVVMTDWG